MQGVVIWLSHSAHDVEQTVARPRIFLPLVFDPVLKCEAVIRAWCLHPVIPARDVQAQRNGSVTGKLHEQCVMRLEAWARLGQGLNHILPNLLGTKTAVSPKDWMYGQFRYMSLHGDGWRHVRRALVILSALMNA